MTRRAYLWNRQGTCLQWPYTDRLETFYWMVGWLLKTLYTLFIHLALMITTVTRTYKAVLTKKVIIILFKLLRLTGRQVGLCNQKSCMTPTHYVLIAECVLLHIILCVYSFRCYSFCIIFVMYRNDATRRPFGEYVNERPR